MDTARRFQRRLVLHLHFTPNNHVRTQPRSQNSRARRIACDTRPGRCCRCCCFCCCCSCCCYCCCFNRKQSASHHRSRRPDRNRHSPHPPNLPIHFHRHAQACERRLTVPATSQHPLCLLRAERAPPLPPQTDSTYSRSLASPRVSEQPPSCRATGIMTFWYVTRRPGGPDVQERATSLYIVDVTVKQAHDDTTIPVSTPPGMR